MMQDELDELLRCFRHTRFQIIKSFRVSDFEKAQQLRMLSADYRTAKHNILKHYGKL